MQQKGYLVVERRSDLIWKNYPISRGKNTSYRGFDQGFCAYLTIDEWIESSNSSIDWNGETIWNSIKLDDVLSYFTWLTDTYPDQTFDLLYICEETDTEIPDTRFGFNRIRLWRAI